MKKEEDYIRDIAEIRSMMERSSKFLSLSGWAGILAGIYALAGAWITLRVMRFHPEGVRDDSFNPELMPRVVIFALIILVLALVTAIFFSRRNAHKQGVKLWNHTT